MPKALGLNPKDLLGMKKPPLELCPAVLEIITAMVMKLGAKKYGPYNWRDNKVRRTVYLAAAKRHINSALDGEDSDEESGMPHEASAAACMAIVLDALVTGNLVDDRPRVGASALVIKLLTEFTKHWGEKGAPTFVQLLAEHNQKSAQATARRKRGKARRNRRRQ